VNTLTWTDGGRNRRLSTKWAHVGWKALLICADSRPGHRSGGNHGVGAGLARSPRPGSASGMREQSLCFKGCGLVEGLDQFFRRHQPGIVLHPGATLWILSPRISDSFHTHQDGTDRRLASRSGHAPNFELRLLQRAESRELLCCKRRSARGADQEKKTPTPHPPTPVSFRRCSRVPWRRLGTREKEGQRRGGRPQTSTNMDT
jgi:hypothetical protein